MKWALVWLCAAVPLAAQGPTDGVGTAARTGFVFDGYYFGASYAFDHVVEWTLPVGLSHRLGSHLTVDLSSGYAHAAAATTSGTLEVSGATDTDVRMSWAGASGHVIVSVAGTLPTGKKPVDSSAVPLLSALATELLNFTTPSFGTGGGVTGGFATAVKLGERWAGGVGGSYRWRARYTPVAGSGDLAPGGEGRVRLGAEGPVGGRGYFRGAAVYAKVSRAAVYKRMKAGGLTAFCFDIIGKTKTVFGNEKKLKEWPLIYIPVAECKAWGAELDQRAARIKANRATSDGHDGSGARRIR